MLKFLKNNLVRKVFVLAVMLGCLSFVSYSKTAVRTDCEDCLPNLEACNTNCYEHVKPDHQAACLSICETGYEICVAINCP